MNIEDKVYMRDKTHRMEGLRSGSFLVRMSYAVVLLGSSSSAADFAVTVRSTSRIVTQGQSTTYVINSGVVLGMLNLPNGYAVGTGFNPTTVFPPDNRSAISTLTPPPRLMRESGTL